MRKSTQKIIKELDKFGLLLVQDASFPNVCSIIAGERITGSWWGHAQGNEIYEALGEVHDSNSVLGCKFISGKETLLHKKLWPEFFALLASPDDRKLDELSPLAKQLYIKLGKEGQIRLDEVKLKKGEDKKSLRKARLELEKKLLAYGTNIHSESGHHIAVLQSWDFWKKVSKFKLPKRRVSLSSARSYFEELVSDLNNKFQAKGKLPW